MAQSQVPDIEEVYTRSPTTISDTDYLKTKVFNDPIHGHIELHPLCVKIIDTPQFQRLRFIKQLGGCYFVFPGASHNRFEHSIGVGHLAGQLVKLLQERQPELDISNKDVLCVKIAGLCHDLGHGPFSHLFDGKFISGMKKKWKHEEGSILMFDHLVEENKLENDLELQDRNFIKELINPTESDTREKDTGRGKDKDFLYDIVANKRNGIDVDKWDYFARDCHMLGIRNNFDHDRLMKFSRVIEVDGVKQICFRDKEAFNLYEMFHTRSTLHRRAYQHKVTKIIEAMITDALTKADAYIEIPGKAGEMLKMSECIGDTVAFTKLTDEILQQIMLSTKPELEPSQTIINNVLCRRLYKCVGEIRPKDRMALNKSDLMAFMTDEERISDIPLTENDVDVQTVFLDYGNKDKNPMENVRFFKKDNPDVPFPVSKSEVSHMLPEKFSEQIIRVYCKDLKSDSKTEILRRCFTEWCRENNMEIHSN